MTAADQRARLDALAALNELDMQKFPGNSELAARISSYELAYRMQGCAPGAVDLNSESEATKRLYGLDNKITEPYGKQCLLARRLVERGVRFVQIFSGGVGDQNVDTWDAHGDIKSNHTQHAAEVDLPTAGLLMDLKSRGLLDTTLVIMHSEFGRMPISQRGVGRDHNPGTQTVLMFGAGITGGQVIGASDEFGRMPISQRGVGRDHNPGTQTVLMFGAGITGGQVIGASDEFGYKAEVQPISYHDLHATILHLLGLDHKKLTYRFNGRDMRLTDVFGTLIPQIVNA
jgi:hypothetical protein